MPDLQNPRVAVYLDFDNIVMSWYDRVHGRNSYSADRQKIIAEPDAPEIAQKLKEQKKRGVKKPERVHTTRMVPKRTEEILDGGSIYWVIKGEVLCRERILDIRPFVDKDGIGRCRLVLDPKCVPVRPRPYRAFQGWRYLDPKDAPPDLDRLGRGTANLPEPLRRELRELGLL